MQDADSKMKNCIHETLSDQEKAWLKVQFDNAITVAGRNAMKDANHAFKLNLVDPPKSYAQIKKDFSKKGGGKNMYDEINKSIDKKYDPACFVAGTLVHTKEGLRPIEEIKVGDYVLSKPESGIGEVSYKPVLQTFESESDNLYFVPYLLIGKELPGENIPRDNFLIVTGNHPIWVIAEDDFPVANSKPITINEWLCADHLRGSAGMTLQLHGGRKVLVTDVRRVKQTKIPGLGWIDDRSLGGIDQGHIIDFNAETPQYCRGHIDNAPGILFEEYELFGVKFDDLYVNENIDWSDKNKLRRKVYNIEVEDNHTYFVGSLGIWVHNICEIKDFDDVQKISELCSNCTKPLAA